MNLSGKYEIISIEMFAKTCIHGSFALIIRNSQCYSYKKKAKVIQYSTWGIDEKKVALDSKSN